MLPQSIRVARAPRCIVVVISFKHNSGSCTAFSKQLSNVFTHEMCTFPKYYLRVKSSSQRHKYCVLRFKQIYWQIETNNDWVMISRQSFLRHVTLGNMKRR